MLAKTKETAISAAFGLRGVSAADAELDAALAKYLNVTANDVVRLQERVRIAIEKLSGKGHGYAAGDGHATIAQPRQPNEDEAGQPKNASDGHNPVAPSSSPNRGGEGQEADAGNGHLTFALPAREPSAEQRAASAKVEAASARAALNIFDQMKTSDGKAWGNVGAHELDGMHRDGVMAKALKDWIGPLSDKDRFKSIRELMNPKQFDLVLARVRGQNHVA